MPRMLPTELASISGESRASSREALVESGQALLSSNPSMAYLLFVQAAALVTSRKLKGKIRSMAAAARSQAEQVRAGSAQARGAGGT